MAEYDLVITNAVCVTAADVSPYDVAIRDEKIVLLAPSGSLKDAKTKRLIDAEGGYVMVFTLPSDFHLKINDLHYLTARRNRLPCAPAGAQHVRQGIVCRQL